jgi:hypothetical protein
VVGCEGLAIFNRICSKLFLAVVDHDAKDQEDLHIPFGSLSRFRDTHTPRPLAASEPLLPAADAGMRWMRCIFRRRRVAVGTYDLRVGACVRAAGRACGRPAVRGGRAAAAMCALCAPQVRPRAHRQRASARCAALCQCALCRAVPVRAAHGRAQRGAPVGARRCAARTSHSEPAHLSCLGEGASPSPSASSSASCPRARDRSACTAVGLAVACSSVGSARGAGQPRAWVRVGGRAAVARARYRPTTGRNRYGSPRPRSAGRAPSGRHTTAP